jgi:TonB family protein
VIPLRLVAPPLALPHREALADAMPPEIRATAKPPSLSLPSITPLPPAPAPTPFESAVPAAARPEAPKIQTGGFAAASARSGSAAPKILLSAGFDEPRAETGEQAHYAPRTGAFGDVRAPAPAAAAMAATPDAGFAAALPGMAPQSPASQTASAGFGDSVAVAGASPAAPVKASAGFAAASIAAHSRELSAAAPAARTRIEILFKPRPAYTPEARKLAIQGDVVLMAWFEANGQVRVERLLRGLGHGLDESAIRAAEAIRFRPATEFGRPIDTDATVRITFQLAN